MNQSGETNFLHSKWRGKRTQILAAATANLSSVAYGMAMTWATPSLPLLKSETTSPIDGGRPITAEEESWLGSLVFFGALTASPVYGYISQRYGRKMCGYLTVIPYLIGWLPIILSDSIYLFYAARFIMGFSSGGVLAFCPMYTGEIAEDSIRGTLGTLRSTIGYISALFIVSVGPLMSIRDMAIINIVLPLVFAIAYFWLPESPLFLMKTGRTKEALEALTWLRGGNQQAAQEEVTKLSAVVKDSLSKNVSLRGLLSSRGTRRGLLICAVLGTAQQWSGIYPVISYCVSLFQAAGGSVSPNMASTIVTSVQLVGSITSSIFLDLAGRRIMLICSQISMAISLGGLGLYFYLQQLEFDMSTVGVLPMVFVAIYVLSLSIGLGSSMYVIMAEIFCPEARGLATSVTTMTTWTMAFLATKFYQSLVDGIGLYGCYWLFASVCIACILFTIVAIPETKNRSLESILKELNGQKKSDEECKIEKSENLIRERYPYVVEEFLNFILHNFIKSVY